MVVSVTDRIAKLADDVARNVYAGDSDMFTQDLQVLLRKLQHPLKGVIYQLDGKTDMRLKGIRQNASDGYEKVAKTGRAGSAGAFVQMLNDLHFVLSMIPDCESSGGTNADN